MLTTPSYSTQTIDVSTHFLFTTSSTSHPSGDLTGISAVSITSKILSIALVVAPGWFKTGRLGGIPDISSGLGMPGEISGLLEWVISGTKDACAREIGFEDDEVVSTLKGTSLI